MTSVKSEDAPGYVVDELARARELDQAERAKRITKEDEIIERARGIILSRFERGDHVLESPGMTRQYLQVMLGGYEHEVFAVVMIDNRNRVIAFHEMFRGTVDGASVYPREVVKQVLADNAAAVILVHNHPSGVAEPSQADIRITERLSDALSLIDVRILDHLIVGEEITSFAERGLV